MPAAKSVTAGKLYELVKLFLNLKSKTWIVMHQLLIFQQFQPKNQKLAIPNAAVVSYSFLTVILLSGCQKNILKPQKKFRQRKLD